MVAAGQQRLLQGLPVAFHVRVTPWKALGLSLVTLLVITSRIEGSVPHSAPRIHQEKATISTSEQHTPSKQSEGAAPSVNHHALLKVQSNLYMRINQSDFDDDSFRSLISDVERRKSWIVSLNEVPSRQFDTILLPQMEQTLFLSWSFHEGSDIYLLCGEATLSWLIPISTRASSQKQLPNEKNTKALVNPVAPEVRTLVVSLWEFEMEQGTSSSPRKLMMRKLVNLPKTLSVHETRHEVDLYDHNGRSAMRSIRMEINTTLPRAPAESKTHTSSPKLEWSSLQGCLVTAVLLLFFQTVKLRSSPSKDKFALGRKSNLTNSSSRVISVRSCDVGSGTPSTRTASQDRPTAQVYGITAMKDPPGMHSDTTESEDDFCLEPPPSLIRWKAPTTMFQDQSPVTCDSKLSPTNSLSESKKAVFADSIKKSVQHHGVASSASLHHHDEPRDVLSQRHVNMMKASVDEGLDSSHSTKVDSNLPESVDSDSNKPISGEIAKKEPNLIHGFTKVPVSRKRRRITSLTSIRTMESLESNCSAGSEPEMPCTGHEASYGGNLDPTKPSVVPYDTSERPSKTIEKSQGKKRRRPQGTQRRKRNKKCRSSKTDCLPDVAPSSSFTDVARNIDDPVWEFE